MEVRDTEVKVICTPELWSRNNFGNLFFGFNGLWVYYFYHLISFYPLPISLWWHLLVNLDIVFYYSGMLFFFSLKFPQARIIFFSLFIWKVYDLPACSLHRMQLWKYCYGYGSEKQVSRKYRWCFYGFSIFIGPACLACT